tara:strand:- start:1807 stop:3300 length:1494 start_codon:yes stop_codon:yes gene_type:complete
MVSQGYFSGSSDRNKRITGSSDVKTAGIKGFLQKQVDKQLNKMTKEGRTPFGTPIGGSAVGEEGLGRFGNKNNQTSFVSPRGNEVTRVASSDLSSFRVGKPEVRLANVQSYTGSDTKPYAPDRTDSYIKEAENRYKPKSTYEKQREQAKNVEKSFGLDPRGVTYTPRDESKFAGSVVKSSLGLPDKTLTTKERILGNKPVGYREGDGLTVTPKNFSTVKGLRGTAFQVGAQLDYKNKFGLSPDKITGGSMYGNDPVTQAYVKAMQQSTADSLATEDRLKKEQLAAKEQAKIDAANARFEKIRKDFLNDPEYKKRLEQAKNVETKSPVKDETSVVDRAIGFLNAIGTPKATKETGMPSNPGSQRQTGVGKSAGDLSRHKTGRSASKGGISRSKSRGQGGGTSSRSRGGVSRGGSRSNTGSRSTSRGARGGSTSRSRGGTGSGRTSTSRSASSASRSRTGRSRTRCDIRTKINISPLINSNLVKDDLAKVAYFVQEIKK